MNYPETSQFLFYGTEDGNTSVQVIVDADKETIWTTQKGMSEIFDVDISGISRHIAGIFESGELEEKSNLQKMQIAGSTKPVTYYNLNVIIAVGYRANSLRATRFRIWATQVLKEYLIKGFALDDERLKQGGQMFGKAYFDELLERIREIRASERIFWRKVTDIFAQCSVDYDPKSSTAKNFFATVQNKMHWAISKHTAAEIIASRADATLPNMNLTSWKGQKKGYKILLSDAQIAKNYLSEKELSELNRIVSMYLDFAENLALRGKEMTMEDWVQRLDSFLQFNEYDILHHMGNISKEAAESIAKKEYQKFRIKQDIDYKSDFDAIIENVKRRKLPKENGG
jgi:hypothetical protein